GFSTFLVGATSYLTFRPTDLFNRSSMELLAHFDIDENVPASGNVSNIRTPTLKPLSGSSINSAGAYGVTPAELAEFGDAETSVQLPNLAGVTDGHFTSVDDVNTANENLANVVGQNASDQVTDVFTLAEKELTEIARLVLPVKPDVKPDTANFAPLIPKSKGKQPKSLASLAAPEHSIEKTKRAVSELRGSGTKTLSLFSVNTGDRIKATYMKNGKYVKSELKRLNWLMRDRRTGGTRNIDPKLYDLMYKLTADLGVTGSTVNVISGYRSKKTNNMLRRRSNGVASSSYHTRGKAVDIAIPSVRLSSVHKRALSLNGGGVGYYPSSNFVHIDTGPVRNWPSKYKHIARKYQRSA
ncbi:MAG: YcbK family protein, partial [Alphaproteobacteria bacterium]